MTCGSEVVASRVSGNPELVTHGQTGLLYPFGRPADLARWIQMLVDEAAPRATLSGAGSELIRTCFSI
jgi:glycosyltransferase involved in cell wall biosynthesis